MVWSGAASRSAATHRDDAPERVAPQRGTQTSRDVVLRVLSSRTLIFVLVGAALFSFARAFQEPGHGWGDDFALYVNQARGLTDGTSGDVVADTRFAIDNSAYASFSPTSYPWGFPALLAGLVAFKGIDYSLLKVVPTLSLVGAVLVLYLLLEPRLSRLEAILVTAFFGLNIWYLMATDQVLSDLTSWFFVVLTLYVLDRRVRARRLLVGNGALAAALCALAAFNVRREGALLLAAILAAQIVAVLVARRAGQLPPRREVQRAMIAPFAAFFAGAAILQFVQPATLMNPTEDVGQSGLRNFGFNFSWYRNPLAEYFGLKEIGPNDLSLFDSVLAGNVALTAVLVLAVLGVVAAIVRDPQRDVHLVVALLLISFAVLVQPFREARYLIVLAPLILYFTMRGARSAVTFVARGSSLSVVRLALPSLLIVPLFVSSLSDTKHAFDYHREYEYTSWGPSAPDAQGLFTAVETFTDPRDVVVFFQARTMNLYTRRRAIQGNSVPMMVNRGDWYAMARNSDYIQTPLTDEQGAALGFVKVWENATFVLWRIPDRPPAPACC